MNYMNTNKLPICLNSLVTFDQDRTLQPRNHEASRSPGWFRFPLEDEVANNTSKYFRIRSYGFVINVIFSSIETALGLIFLRSSRQLSP